MTIPEDTCEKLPIEQVIPRLQLWKQIVMTANSLQPLIQLKSQLTELMTGNSQIYISETNLFEQINNLKQ